MKVEDLVIDKEYWISDDSEDDAISLKALRKFKTETSGGVVFFETLGGYDLNSWKYFVDPDDHKHELVDSWEDLGEIEGWYLDEDSEIVNVTHLIPHRTTENLATTESLPKAYRALCKLTQLAKQANNGWIPDWSDYSQNKFTISSDDGDFGRRIMLNQGANTTEHPLSFEHAFIRNQFFKKYNSLIEDVLLLL